MLLYCLVFTILNGFCSSSPIASKKEAFNLTIIHINDIHAHFEQTNVHSTRCRPEDDAAEDCYGGVPRVYQKVLEIKRNYPDALFLNAGDFYQGSVWYTKFKYKPMIEFGNLLDFDAMGVGNHDFDDAIAGFAPFAEETSYALLASNLISTVTDGSFEEGTHFNKSTVKMVNGRKIGIIGYITRSTAYNFPNGTLSFSDEIDAVRSEAKRLKAENVDIIIALGHSGYDIDQELAEKIPELDIVVGGHSHTFLYTDNGEGLPSTERPRGKYPTYTVNKETGKVIPVVQAYCYTKYLGYLQLSFDENGELLNPVDGTGVHHAEPILLDNSVEQNQTVLERMVPWQADLEEYKTILGENTILLHERAPSEESNIGDVICQSMAAVYNDTLISFNNNGGIRSSLAVGNLTYEDVLYVLPFDNTIDFVTMSGAGLKKSMENAAYNIDAHDVNKYPGFGYQLSGLRLTMEITSGNAGNRVTELKVANNDGSYSDIQEDHIYNVALPSFLTGRSARFQKQMRGVFEDQIISYQQGDVMIYEALRDYILKNSPLAQEVDGRINISSLLHF